MLQPQWLLISLKRVYRGPEDLFIYFIFLFCATCVHTGGPFFKLKFFFLTPLWKLNVLSSNLFLGQPCKEWLVESCKKRLERMREAWMIFFFFVCHWKDTKTKMCEQKMCNPKEKFRGSYSKSLTAWAWSCACAHTHQQLACSPWQIDNRPRPARVESSPAGPTECWQRHKL